MLQSFKGNLDNEEVVSPVNNQIGDCHITYHIISNMDSVPVHINIIIQSIKGERIQVCPKNLTLGVGESFTNLWDKNLIFLDREILIINADGKIDFYFALENDK